MKNKKPKNMFSWMNPKLEIRETGKFGKGVFAKENIKKDEVVIVMGGYVLTIEDDNNLRGVCADKPIEISNYFFIGPRKASDLNLMPQHFVNHSCNPNVGFRGQIFMVAMKNILSVRPMPCAATWSTGSKCWCRSMRAPSARSSTST